MPAISSQTGATITEEDYLKDEKQADTRHEYVNGHVYAMAGASKRHNRIARNFITRMESAADAHHCEIYFSDIKVRTEKYKTYYYPDVVVGCVDDEEDEYYLEKPCLIVEVTSTATQRKDYLEKALSYQSIPSLQAYLIVAQDKPQVDMLVRNGSDWDLQQFDRMEDSLSLPCLMLTLNLTAIYAGVNNHEIATGRGIHNASQNWRKQHPDNAGFSDTELQEVHQRSRELHAEKPSVWD